MASRRRNELHGVALRVFARNVITAPSRKKLCVAQQLAGTCSACKAFNEAQHHLNRRTPSSAQRSAPMELRVIEGGNSKQELTMTVNSSVATFFPSPPK